MDVGLLCFHTFLVILGGLVPCLLWNTRQTFFPVPCSSFTHLRPSYAWFGRIRYCYNGQHSDHRYLHEQHNSHGSAMSELSSGVAAVLEKPMLPWHPYFFALIPLIEWRVPVIFAEELHYKKFSIVRSLLVFSAFAEICR